MSAICCNTSAEPSPVLFKKRRNNQTPNPTYIYSDLNAGNWCHGYEDSGGGYPGTYFDGGYGAAPMDLANSGVSLIAGGRFGGNCPYFDGTASLSRADEAALRAPADSHLTFSAWVKLDNTAGDHPIVSKRAGGGIEYELRYDGTARRFAWQFYDSTRQKIHSAYSFVVPAANTWYLLIADWNAADRVVSLAVNAGSPRLGSSEDWVYATGHAFRIGEGLTGNLRGLINDVSRYNRLLNQTERVGLLGRSFLDLNVVFTAAAPGATGAGLPGYPVNSAPAAPTGIDADTSGTNPVLTWVIEAGNTVVTEIQRDDGAGFNTVTQIFAEDHWTDTAVTLPAAATYRVRSINLFGASDWSAEASTTAGLTTDEGTITTDDGTLTTDES